MQATTPTQNTQYSMLKAVISNIDEWCIRVQEAFPDYDFNVVPWGSWVRVFVLLDGVQLGRINLQPFCGGHTFYGVRHYKPEDMDYEREDLIFYALAYWLRTGIVIDMTGLLEKAKAEVQQKKEKVLQWRSENPLPTKEKIVNGKPVMVKRKRKAVRYSYMRAFRTIVSELTTEPRI